jgi:ribonuclease VapC
MFLDASAMVAILGREPDFESIHDQLNRFQGQLYTSPLARFEAANGLARAKATAQKQEIVSGAALADARRAVDALLNGLAVEQVSITPEIGESALEASIRFGKGRGVRARLNFGDCFAYACAKSLGVGLIYKGDDFAMTDLA